MAMKITLASLEEDEEKREKPRVPPADRPKVSLAEVAGDTGHSMSPQQGDKSWKQEFAESIHPTGAAALQHLVSLPATVFEGAEDMQKLLAARAGQGSGLEQFAGDVIGAGGVAGMGKKVVDKVASPAMSTFKKWLLGTGASTLAKEPLKETDTAYEEMLERAKAAGIDMAGLTAGAGMGKLIEPLGNKLLGVNKGKLDELPASTQKMFKRDQPMSENTVRRSINPEDLGAAEVGRAGAQTVQQTQGAGMTRAAMEGAGKMLNMKPDSALTASAKGAMDTKALKGMNDAFVPQATPMGVPKVSTQGSASEVADRLGKVYKQQYDKVFEGTPIPNDIALRTGVDAKDLKDLAVELTGDEKLSGEIMHAAKILEASKNGGNESFNTFYKLINKARHSMPPEFSDARKWLDEFRGKLVKALPEDKQKILKATDAAYPEYLALKDAAGKASSREAGVFTLGDISASSGKYATNRPIYGKHLNAYANFNGAKSGMSLDDLNHLMSEESAFKSPLLKKAFEKEEKKFREEYLGKNLKAGKVTEKAPAASAGIGLGTVNTVKDQKERRKRRRNISSER